MIVVKIIPLILSPFTLRERHSTALEFVKLQLLAKYVQTLLCGTRLVYRLLICIVYKQNLPCEQRCQGEGANSINKDKEQSGELDLSGDM